MTITSHNSATGAELWRGKPAEWADIDEAVQLAWRAQPDWSSLSYDDRVTYLVRYSDIVKERLDRLTVALSEENGKPLWDARSEIQGMINKIPISIEAYDERCKTYTQTLPNHNVLHTKFKPHGVVAVIGPFNFPGHLPNGHIVPALLAGNTVVFKPSELTPRFGELMIDCWKAAELPFEGIVNLVQGGGETGRQLVKHPGIKGVFFTGSEQVGLALSELLASHPEKILALEMGGNNPLIIGTLEDLKTAAYYTIQSAYITSGQRCSCARRLIVPQGTQGDQFIEVLQSMIRNIQVGFYNTTPEPFMGPVISLKAAEQLLKAQENLLKKGGQALTTMQQVFPGKALLTPGLIDVSSITQREDVEYFGPLLQIIRSRDIYDAYKEATNTRFGLTAGIFTDKKEEFDQFYRIIQAGVINWNAPLTGASSRSAFGGLGISGNHRPSAYFAADYCAYPVATMESEKLHLPTQLLPGITP